ncbi:MAG: FKBP-type peptidyl-prolyl cis-trans isomerase, partial [Bacteroidota bacterium]
MRPLPSLLTALLLMIAFSACDSSDDEVDNTDLNIGTVANANSVVIVAFEGRLENGTVFDSSSRATLALVNTIPGFRSGITGMEVGETKTFSVPPEEAYGSNPPSDSGIPPDATLIFEVTLIDIVTIANANSVVVVAYEGRLENGSVFDSSSRATFPLA